MGVLCACRMEGVMPDRLINFGAAKTPGLPCPVFWLEATEHYHAICRACDYESLATVDRWQARRWAIEHQQKCPGMEEQDVR